MTAAGERRLFRVSMRCSVYVVADCAADAEQWARENPDLVTQGTSDVVVAEPFGVRGDEREQEPWYAGPGVGDGEERMTVGQWLDRGRAS